MPDQGRPLLDNFPRNRILGCTYQGHEPYVPEESQRGVVGDVIISDNGRYLYLVRSNGTVICSFHHEWGSWHINEEKRMMSVNIPMIGEFTIFDVKPLA